jgi:hypothetical protein
MIRLEQRQAVSPHMGTLLQTVVCKTLTRFFEKKEFGDSRP